jgi:hypothetical protein
MKNGTKFGPGDLSVCALAQGQTRWRLLKPGYVPLVPEPQAIATGDAPQPFTVSSVEIPVVIRFRTQQAAPPGMYASAVRFTASTGQTGQLRP